MENVSASGTYKVKETGEAVVYTYDYQVVTSVEACIADIGEDKVKALIQRMLKVDANNVAREKAKVENGHSTRQPLTEEQKAQKKSERLADRTLLDLLKSKGLSIEDIQGM